MKLGMKDEKRRERRKERKEEMWKEDENKEGKE